MIGWLRRFGAFWYDFIIGDDWRVAAGVVIGFALTYGVHRAGAPAWWVTPVIIALLLPLALWRAVAAATKSR
ncbi:MAG: hypothetical protein LBQ06_00030 [Frankiaceae bacterium]|nr:hypothetical protein [Frankiaceae bacterium]